MFQQDNVAHKQEREGVAIQGRHGAAYVSNKKEEKEPRSWADLHTEQQAKVLFGKEITQTQDIK